MKLALDPGHGGEDSGCIWPIGAQQPSFREKDLVLEFCILMQKIARAIPSLDLEVTLTRTEDRNLGNAEAGRLSQGADLVLPIHLDSATGAAEGLRAYYVPDTAQGDREKHIAEILQASAPVALRRVDRPVAAAPERSEGWIRNVRAVVLPHAAHAPTVLLELCFLSDPEDRAYVASQRGQVELALSLLAGVSRALTSR